MASPAQLVNFRRDYLDFLAAQEGDACKKPTETKLRPGYRWVPYAETSPTLRRSHARQLGNRGTSRNGLPNGLD